MSGDDTVVEGRNVNDALYRLVADDDEAGWVEIGSYAERDDAEADRVLVESRYPGRPEWVTFEVQELRVTGRRSIAEIEDALISLADLSEIQRTWRLPPEPPR